MNYNNTQFSLQKDAIVESLTDLIGILDDVASSGGSSEGSQSFTDSNGNEIRLNFDLKGDDAILTISAGQRHSNITITITEPARQMIKKRVVHKF